MDAQGTAREGLDVYQKAYTPPRAGVSGIVRKLFLIMSKVPYLAKDKFNDQQKYKYVSEQQVKEVIQPLLVENQLLFLPVDQEIVATDAVSDSKQRVTSVKITWEIHDIETGEVKPIAWIGSGADSMDKGVPKAITMAIKTWCTGAFMIPTGDDPDDPGAGGNAGKRAPQPRSRGKQQDPNSLITDGQRSRLYALANKMQLPKEQVLSILASYEYKSSTEIRVKDYDAICREIDPSSVE